MASPTGPRDHRPRTRASEVDDERRRAEKQRRIYELGMMDLTRAPRNLPAAVGDQKEQWRRLARLPKFRRRIIYALILISTVAGLGAGVWLATYHGS